MLIVLLRYYTQVTTGGGGRGDGPACPSDPGARDGNVDSADRRCGSNAMAMVHAGLAHHSGADNITRAMGAMPADATTLRAITILAIAIVRALYFLLPAAFLTLFLFSSKSA